MPLPGSCADPAEACCENLFTLVESFVTVAADAVEECVGPLCGEFGRFVSHNVPIGPGDYVAGWWVDLRPGRTNGTGRQFVLPKMVSTIVVRLVETGFPTLDVAGDRIQLPSFEKFDYAARHSYAHAEVATRAILNNLNGHGFCDPVTLVRMQPLQPEMDMVAWEWTLSTSMRL